jgi:hypothetical protein
MASGVKVAGMQYWLFYGTSEILIVLSNYKRKQMQWDVAR